MYPFKFLLIILLFHLTLNAQTKQVDVYIFAGQSNMRGVGQCSEIKKDDKTPTPNIKMLIGSSAFSIIPDIINKKKSFGPEVGFALEMNKTNPRNDIYIIKMAMDGRPLHWSLDKGGMKDDKPGPGRQNFHPGNSASDPNMGLLYKRLLAKINKTLSSLQEENISYKIKGILWMQGEADAKFELSSMEYAKSLKEFKERLQSDLKSGDIPLVFGQALANYEGNRFKFLDNLRNSQLNADCNSGHKATVPNTWLVKTKGFAMNNDQVHFSTEGQLSLGKEMAKTMLKALSKK